MKKFVSTIVKLYHSLSNLHVAHAPNIEGKKNYDK